MNSPPQYKLSVGRRFTYCSAESGVPRAAITADLSGLATEWNCYVIGCDRDGFSRIVFSQGPAVRNPSRQQALPSEGYFDISADGQIIENATITPLANPAMVFPRLPGNAAELTTGWNASLNVDDTRREFSLGVAKGPSTPSMFRFMENSRTALDAIYLASRDREYEFDRELGLVQSVETTFRRSWPADHVPVSETAWLTNVSDLDSSDVSTLATSAAEYFDACAEYQQLIELALWDLLHSARWLQNAREAFERARSAIAHPVVRSWLDRKLALLAQEQAGLLDGNQRLAEAIGKPAPPWRAVDLDGVVRESSGFCGRPLVLCFWDRGCAWSLRTLLALNRVATEMRDRSVAFLGVGAATNMESARLVWQSLGMQFPTVIEDQSEESIAASYMIEGYPATIVIDRDGVLRRHRGGHSFAIASMLAAEFAKLRGEPEVMELRLEL